jgi:hypothetical protein
MTTQQIGRFSVCADWIRLDPAKVARMFAMMDCVVVRAEMLYAEHRIDYIALSPRFREIACGAVTPKYEIICTDHPNGELWTVHIKELAP